MTSCYAKINTSTWFSALTSSRDTCSSAESTWCKCNHETLYGERLQLWLRLLVLLGKPRCSEDCAVQLQNRNVSACRGCRPPSAVLALLARSASLKQFQPIRSVSQPSLCLSWWVSQDPWTCSQLLIGYSCLRQMDKRQCVFPWLLLS